MEAELNPVLERVMSQVADPSSFEPPAADYWYDLHDSVELTVVVRAARYARTRT